MLQVYPTPARHSRQNQQSPRASTHDTCCRDKELRTVKLTVSIHHLNLITFVVIIQILLILDVTRTQRSNQVAQAEAGAEICQK